MAKILIRLFILCIVTTMFVTYLIFFIDKTIIEKDLMSNVEENTLMRFSYLDNYLKKYPKEKWQEEVDKLRPEGASIIKIIPINELPLDAAQINEIKNNRLVFIFNKTKNYFPGIVYKKVGDTPYVYQEFVDFSDAEKGKRFFGWIPAIIIKKLMNTSEDKWPSILTAFSQQYGYPLSVFLFKKVPLSESQKKQMLKDHWFFDWLAKPFKSAELIYVPFSNNQKVLVVGPLKTNPIKIYESYILFFLALIIIEGIIFIFTLLFLKSLKKIHSLAEAYGHGKFDYQTHFNKNSSLFPLFNNLKIMGNRIKQLIYSHKELTHTVSHELKTPLSRLRFALELLKKEKNSTKMLDRIDSMENDITELEELVSEILNYGKLDYLALEVKFERLSLSELLRTSIDCLKKSVNEKQIKIIFRGRMEDITIFGNKLYILRALNNIFMNALRFSQKIIRVSCEKVDSTLCRITIEDDGPGISDNDKKRVFEPFVQLSNPTTDQAKSYGLGLAITKKIIDQHNWNIFISDSDLGGVAIIIEIRTIV